MQEILTVVSAQARTSRAKGPQAAHIVLTRCHVCRRVTRHAARAWVGAALEKVAEQLQVSVAGGEVGDAEPERSHSVQSCAALEQGGHAAQLVVLRGHVNWGVRDVVSAVDNG